MNYNKRIYITIVLAIIIGLIIGSASAYTYYIWKDDLVDFKAPSYSTIIPTNSPLRNSITQQGACNGGYSPNPCTNTIPEPGTIFIFIWGLLLILFITNNKRFRP